MGELRLNGILCISGQNIPGVLWASLIHQYAQLLSFPN